MRLRTCLSLLVLALSACTYRIREHNVVIARTAPPVALAALQATFPDYRIEERRIDGDGATLYSLRFLRDDAVATVLYFGGNGYTVARFAERSVAAYAGVPVNVVLVDHRGYGSSTGAASLDALLEDAVRVHDHLRGDASLAGMPLLVHGHSLGSFMAGHVASGRRLDGLVLEGSVTTSEAWAAFLRSRQKPWARMLVWRVKPVGALAGKGNLPVAATLDEPVLFVAGEDDVTTPPHFARALFDAAPLPADRKRLLVVPGHGHMDAAQSPEFRAAFAAFVHDLVNAGEAPG